MAEPRSIAVLTTGRQDYGILRSTLLALQRDPRFRLRVWAGGMHLSSAHGRTLDRILQDGLTVDAELEILQDPDPAAQCARMIAAVAQVCGHGRPDALLLLGDRYETLAAGVAASVVGLPIVHMHGGEESEGAIDNAFRHALTKLAQLHLVSHALHRRRVVQMGEDPASVIEVGAPGLDNLHRDDLPDRAELERELGVSLTGPVVIVTLHPTTLGGDSQAEVRALAAAMEQVPATYVITQPNSDTGAEPIRSYWQTWAKGRPQVALVDALGERRFWGLLRIAAAVAGNSSSGILEAPSAGLPVVNVGDRQLGRLRSAHVRDVPAQQEPIRKALAWSIDPATRQGLAGCPGPYLAGPAAPRVVEALARWTIPVPPRKHFHMLPEPPT